MYRTLSSTHITTTALRLADRIATSFPNSGLSGVARELAQLAGETDGRVQDLRRPAWALRILSVAAIVLALAAAVLWPLAVDVRPDVGGVSDFLQGVEAAINN